ncbi:MAG: hypothetical protein AMJ43_08770 [Coxiella sp. DG_40]|nr:MAG: hypothetical protein AMJ43_08770 [Coxiella sp. DG_40]
MNTSESTRGHLKILNSQPLLPLYVLPIVFKLKNLLVSVIKSPLKIAENTLQRNEHKQRQKTSYCDLAGLLVRNDIFIKLAGSQMPAFGRKRPKK